ncbi:DNA polymerase III subunit delta' [Flavobacteriaceae bacterium]|jgi:DNA polymerase-3 subunit delta'|nr:DNA polymerase III subunit delta' [Flavobacteriaceae bacterium]|tara:strand:+ start:8138 stop:9268 length:1131 start_codon:yes stop_codon:yes gene_type:complete
MLFRDIIGHTFIKKELQRNLTLGRIPHCQLICGPEGSGALPLAIAYARQVICNELDQKTEFCNLKISELKHPDLHFVYPVANNQDVKSKAISSSFITNWREFLSLNPYGNLFEWYMSIGIENKQGKIGKDEAENLIKKMSLKSYEGGWKAVIIWMAEKMNPSATNKLLKLIEEPPEKTLFIFVAEDELLLMDTLVSRCQRINLNKIPNDLIKKALIDKGFSNELANKASLESNGSYNKAFSFAKGKESDSVFEKWFQSWVRSAFKVKKNKEAVLELVDWSKTVSKSGRETQKKFIAYSLEIFRQALLLNYGISELTFYSPSTDFNFDSFSKFIGGANVEEISLELENAYIQIQSNGNPNMIFTDLSLKLTRLIHKN